jgi:hypothetical protein
MIHAPKTSPPRSLTEGDPKIAKLHSRRLSQPENSRRGRLNHLSFIPFNRLDLERGSQ